MTTQMVSDSEYDKLREDAQVASNNLTLAKRTYDGQRKKLENAQTKARMRHEANVASAEGKLKQAQDELSGLIEQAGKVALYHDRLVVDDVEFHLIPDLKVEVSASSVAKSAYVAAANDSHQVFFTASSSEGGKTLTMASAEEGQARDIASKVPSCVAQYPELAKSAAPKIESARQELEQAKSATAEVTAAQKALDDFVANDTKVAEAQSAFDLANAKLHEASGHTPSSMRKVARSARVLSVVFYALAAVVILLGIGSVTEHPSVGVVVLQALVAFVLAYEAGLRGERARKALAVVASFQGDQATADAPSGQDVSE